MMTATTIPPVEQYPIDIFDDSLDWIAQYVDYEEFGWTRRWRKPGEFMFRISRYNTDGSDRDIQVGYFVSMYRGGEARIGRIKSRSISLSEDGKGSELWTVSGVDAKGILSSRLTIANTRVDTGFDVQSAVAAETAIRYYIDDNVINALNTSGGAGADRVISQFVLETTDGEKGGDVSYQARIQVLTDVIEEILLASDGIGYEVEFLRDTQEFEIQIKAGTDRSATVVFSTDFGNIRAINYSENDDGVVNMVYIWGAGTGNTRTVLGLPAVGSRPGGLARYEGFIDGSATDDSTNQLTAIGNAELAAKGGNETMTFEIMQDNSFSYMTRTAAGDFDLGDIIKVIYSGIATLTGRIIEVNERYGRGSMGHITMTVGTESPDMARIIKSVNNKAATRGRA